MSPVSRIILFEPISLKKENEAMRSLSSTLLTAQKEATRIPYVKVEAGNKVAGVVRLDWTRLYTGA